MIYHWHQKHEEQLTYGQRIADVVAFSMGSWGFIIAQSLFLAAWVWWNSIYTNSFDPPPFSGLNLLLSFEAAYAAPFIMISQNRHAQRDRFQADADYATNLEAKQEIEALQVHLSRLELEKLDRIIELLERDAPIP